MNRDPAPGLEVHAKRPRRLHALHVDHLIARQRAQVDALADLFRQPLHVKPPGAVPGRVPDRLKGQFFEGAADEVPPAQGVSLEESFLLQKERLPVDRRRRQAERWTQSGQADRGLLLDHVPEDPDSLENRGFVTRHSIQWNGSFR